MSAPQFVKANYSDFYGSGMLPALEEVFRSEIELHPSRRELLFNMRSTSNGIYQESEMHDLQQFVQIAEGTEYSYVAPRAGSNKTYTTVKYGLGVSISEEAIKDGKFDEVAALIRQLGRSAQDSREISAMNVFNNAFATTNQTAIDGAALCSTTHTLPGGLTWRNKPTVDVDLSPVALREMLSDFRTEQVSDNGKIYNVAPRILLVHSDEEAYAKELIGSSLKPDTSDNNMNALKGEGLVIVSSPHITDTDAWFLLAPKERTGLKIIESEGIVTKSKEEFDTDSIKYKSKYREIVGVGSALGVMGSSGA